MRLLPRGDAKLAELAAAGDERAFAAIYDRYHQELYRYCRAILGDADEAQDALQGTMASALRALPGESRTIELRALALPRRAQRAISIVRRRQRRWRWTRNGGCRRSPAADAVFESRERLRTLVADLSTLPERQRSALVMRELSGLSHEEIAVALGISPGAARQAGLRGAASPCRSSRRGASMECERVRIAISDGDGRVLRGRKLRAHLRGCAGLRGASSAAIETRPRPTSTCSRRRSRPRRRLGRPRIRPGRPAVGGAGTRAACSPAASAAASSARSRLVCSRPAPPSAWASAPPAGVDLPGVGSDSKPAKSAPRRPGRARTGSPEAAAPGVDLGGSAGAAGASNDGTDSAAGKAARKQNAERPAGNDPEGKSAASQRRRQRPRPGQRPPRARERQPDGHRRAAATTMRRAATNGPPRPARAERARQATDRPIRPFRTRSLTGKRRRPTKVTDSP